MNPPYRFFLDMVPSSSRMLFARCVDVFVEYFFYVSFRSNVMGVIFFDIVITSTGAVSR